MADPKPDAWSDFNEFSFEASETAWLALEKPRPLDSGRIPPRVLVQELTRLAEIAGQVDGRAFRQAIEALEYLGLANLATGRWTEHWHGSVAGNSRTSAYRFAAHRVDELVRCQFHGLSERQIIAYVAAEAELPAATFMAAWTKLRDTYLRGYPNRQKPSRGRRPK